MNNKWVLALLFCTFQMGFGLAPSISNAQFETPSSRSYLNEFEYVSRWCRDIRNILQRALSVGSRADTFEVEKEILVFGAREALAASSSKHTPFFIFTIESGLRDQDIFISDASRLVEHLREVLRNGLEDLERIESYYLIKSDKLVYVSTLLTRSLKSGQRVPLEEQEIAILARAAERGIDLLRLSDRNRTQDADCARRDLDEALRASRMPVDYGTKIRILRAGILSAQSRLQYNNRCTTF